MAGGQNTALSALLVGESKLLKDAKDLINRAAQAGPYLNVMIIGESGTGKEDAAKAISDLAPDRKKLFRALSCGGLSKHLLEAELFGYEKGIHGTAFNSGKGYLDLFSDFSPGCGVLFFDELPEMDISVQGKLLRFLETWSYRPLGGEKDKEAKIRVVSAMQPGRRKRIREDLYHRLADVEIWLPSLNDVLKDRPDDLESIAGALLDRLVRDDARTWEGEKFDQAAANQILYQVSKGKEKLLNHNWGSSNVRELRNYLRRLALLGIDELIVDEHQNNDIVTTKPVTKNSENSSATWSLPPLPYKFEDVVDTGIIRQLQEDYILHVWDQFNGSVSKEKIRKKLNISYNTLDKRINPGKPPRSTGGLAQTSSARKKSR